MTLRTIATVAILAVAAFAQAQSHWPQFRGPAAAGVADDRPLSTKWDVPAGEGVLWKTEIKGLAHSSPVIWADRLFVTTAISKADNQSLRTGLFGAGDSADDMTEHDFKVICLDKKTGKVLWDETVHSGVPKVKRHVKATHVNCTPAVSDRFVVAFFGSEGLYCLAHDGTLKWRKDLGVLDVGPHNGMELQWGFASSPIIVDDKVIVQCDIKANSFLAAFDINDGRELWRTKREDVPGWCTPTAHKLGDTTQIICNGCTQIAAYDAKDGRNVWQLSGGGGIPVPAPVIGDGLIYFTSNHRPLRDSDPPQPVFAVKAEAKGTLEHGSEDKPAPQMAWMKTRIGSYMQTPLLYRGVLYVCKDNGMLVALDAASGDERWKRRLTQEPTGFTASAVAGDGKLYYTSEDGLVSVLAADKDRDALATNNLGETCLATPAISDGVIYWRTRGHVLAIGGK
ncbi:MAG: PQQ-binding-like beta-propeller repeat protein [Phycisphaerae bacterium]